MIKSVPLFLLSMVILNSTKPLMGCIHCKSFNSCLICSIIYFIVLMLFSTLSSSTASNSTKIIEYKLFPQFYAFQMMSFYKKIF